MVGQRHGQGTSSGSQRSVGRHSPPKRKSILECRVPASLLHPHNVDNNFVTFMHIKGLHHWISHTVPLRTSMALQ